MKERVRLRAVVLAAALVVPPTALATNGMWMIGWGAKGTAMGGVGVAYPQDGLAAAYNPAGVGALGETRFDFTVELFVPPRGAVHDSALLPANVTSKDNLYPIPAMGATLSEPTSAVSLGFAFIGAGLGVNYPQPDHTLFNPFGTADDRAQIFLVQMQMLPTLAYRVNDDHFVGASLAVAMQTFRAGGFQAFKDLGFTSDTSLLTNNGHDWGAGWGFRLGYLGQFLDDRLAFGLNYTSRVWMQPFEKYKGLFANSGEFDIPESYWGGLSFKVTPDVDIALDVGRIRYSTISSIANKGPLYYPDPGVNLFPDGCPSGVPVADQPCALGGQMGMGFGWKDQTVYKLGVAWRADPEWTVRAGFNYGTGVIPEDQVLFNIMAPAVVKKHVTAGATWMATRDVDLTATVMHAFKETLRGPTAFGPAIGGVAAVVQPGSSNAALSMSQTSLSLAVGVRF